MKKLTLGVIGTSRKEDEKRVPIHPDHLSTILEGRDGWMKNDTNQKAINIDNGLVKKESVLTFQNRMPDYPDHYKKSKVGNE